MTIKSFIALTAGAAALSVSSIANADAIAVKAAYFQDSDSNATLSFNIEHPIPVLPNLRYNRTNDIEVANFASDLLTDTSLNMTMGRQEITAYYEVLNNGLVHLDLGIGASELTYEGVITSEMTTITESDSEWGGHLYGKARLPFGESGFGLYAEATAGQAGGITFVDAHAGATYTLSLGALDLRAYAGYGTIDYKDLPSYSEYEDSAVNPRFGFEIDL